MRVSTKDQYANVAVKSVFINGEHQRLCVMADDTLGVAEVYLVDDDGLIITNSLGDPTTTTKKGTVKIVLNEDWEYVGGQLRMAE